MGKGSQFVKHVDKSIPEPEGLRNYRISNPASTWEQFISEKRDCYKTLRKQLREDQSGLCAYCELCLIPENEQIAHFHPKSDTASPQNWALEWNNLWLACKGGSQRWMSGTEHHYLPPLPENLSCDERKRDHILDGLVLAPNEVPLFPRIFRFEQQLDRIEIRPDEDLCEQAGVELEKVSRTIKEFNLNCPRLSRARLESYRQIEQAIKKLRESGCQNPHDGFLRLAQRHLRKNDESRWPSFFTLIRWRLGIHAENHLQTIHFRG
jgi:uncharacterized protein (TIGR02646 family)